VFVRLRCVTPRAGVPTAALTVLVAVLASACSSSPAVAPEPGASCEMPAFLDAPLAPGDQSAYA
jgi:hypothetical protein